MSLERAREAAASGDWDEAYGLLMEVDSDGLMGSGDLPLLAEVAYAAGELDVTIEAWERTHALCVEAGDSVAAAGAAVRLAMHLLLDTALMAPVRGWLARAERLLEGEQETSAHAWLAVVRTYERMLTGDLPGAREWSERAIEVGSERDAAACAVGRVAAARLRILGGDVEGGLALLDEAGVAAVSGDLDPLSTGLVYCELVCALQGLAQYDVAEEWTEAMERWCQTSNRKPPWALPGAPGGDSEVARFMRRSGARGAGGLRGAEPVPASRDGMAAHGARPDPVA